jgi:hypothetical protein
MSPIFFIIDVWIRTRRAAVASRRATNLATPGRWVPKVIHAVANFIKKNNKFFRYRHEICCYGERLYVLGGGTSFSVYGFDRIPTFDLQTKTWSSSKTRPDENATIDVVGLIL